MKCSGDSGTRRAFTFLDFVFVMVTLVLVLLTLPYFLPHGCKGSRISCINNLKQIALGYRMWANDHGERFPMEVPFAEGGAKEFALAGEPPPLFRVISNELSTAKPLYCSEDKRGYRTNDFQGMTELNLSYFVGIDAAVSNAQTILAGDRNLTIANVPVTRGLVPVTNSAALGWSSAMHNNAGNIALGDGSAHQVTTSVLQKQSTQSNLQTNRFAVP